MSTVLVVDDEPMLVELLCLRLKAAKYDVITAGDGEEAFQKVISEKPDLMLLDVMMPKLSGYQVMDKIRKEGGEMAAIPVVVMSAKPSMEKFFDTLGVLKFVKKPFNFEDILESINSALNVTGSEPAAVATPEDKGFEGKNVAVITGVDEYILKRLIEFLESKSIKVIKGYDEDESIQKASELKPTFVITQYWEEASKFDAAKIYKGLQSAEETKGIPFFTYCRESVAVEASKDFPRDRIITYEESTDLLAKVDEVLKKVCK